MINEDDNVRLSVQIPLINLTELQDLNLVTRQEVTFWLNLVNVINDQPRVSGMPLYSGLKVALGQPSA